MWLVVNMQLLEILENRDDKWGHSWLGRKYDNLRNLSTNRKDVI